MPDFFLNILLKVTHITLFLRLQTLYAVYFESGVSRFFEKIDNIENK